MTDMITLKGIIDEDFVNYKVPSMTLMFPKCTFKCGFDQCQNALLYKEHDVTIHIEDLCKRYISNPITQSIVCQGLEPMDSAEEVISLVSKLRRKFHCNDDVVIYTGYEIGELKRKDLDDLYWLGNVVMKYGRYIPGQKPHYDETLGVYLASDNQYTERFELHESSY